MTLVPVARRNGDSLTIMRLSALQHIADSLQGNDVKYNYPTHQSRSKRSWLIKARLLSLQASLDCTHIPCYSARIFVESIPFLSTSLRQYRTKFLPSRSLRADWKFTLSATYQTFGLRPGSALLEPNATYAVNRLNTSVLYFRAYNNNE